MALFSIFLFKYFPIVNPITVNKALITENIILAVIVYSSVKERPNPIVKLGKAEGNNFWCVLFPPLCLVDENTTDTEYHILVKDLLKKYF